MVRPKDADSAKIINLSKMASTDNNTVQDFPADTRLRIPPAPNLHLLVTHTHTQKQRYNIFICKNQGCQTFRTQLKVVIVYINIKICVIILHLRLE